MNGPMIVVDGHGGRVGITTHRNGPKCPKKGNFKKIGEKKIWVGGWSGHQKYR